MFVHIWAVGNNLPLLASSEFPANKHERSRSIHAKASLPKAGFAPYLSRLLEEASHPTILISAIDLIQSSSFPVHFKIGCICIWREAKQDEIKCLDPEWRSCAATIMHSFRFKTLPVSSTRWANHFPFCHIFYSRGAAFFVKQRQNWVLNRSIHSLFSWTAGSFIF